MTRLALQVTIPGVAQHPDQQEWEVEGDDLDSGSSWRGVAPVARQHEGYSAPRRQFTGDEPGLGMLRSQDVTVVIVQLFECSTGIIDASEYALTVGQLESRRQGVRMAWPEHAEPIRHELFELVQRRGVLSSCRVPLRQSVTRQESLRMIRAEHPLGVGEDRDQVCDCICGSTAFAAPVGQVPAGKKAVRVVLPKDASQIHLETFEVCDSGGGVSALTAPIGQGVPRP
jgi:hypothetical protein